MICTVWLSLPIVHSSILALTRFNRRILLRSWIQSLALSLGMNIWNGWVLSTQPSTALISSGVPSPSSLGILVASARGNVRYHLWDGI